VPWVYVRREIARSWGVPPWVVDAAPADEVLLEIRIRGVEGRAAAERPPEPGG
jgi:butyrate kinase